MPRLHIGDFNAVVLYFRHSRILRRLRDTPVKRYLLAAEQIGEHDPRLRHLRDEAREWIREQQIATELELLEMELRHPELAEEEDNGPDAEHS